MRLSVPKGHTKDEFGVLVNSANQLFQTIDDNIEIIKKAEEAFRVSDEKYRDLYDNAPDMFVSVDSKTAAIIECNQTLADELRDKKEEIIGRPIFDMYTIDSAKYAKDVLFPLFLRTGSIQGEELQLQRKGGNHLWIRSP